MRWLQRRRLVATIGVVAVAPVAVLLVAVAALDGGSPAEEPLAAEADADAPSRPSGSTASSPGASSPTSTTAPPSTTSTSGASTSTLAPAGSSPGTGTGATPPSTATTEPAPSSTTTTIAATSTSAPPSPPSPPSPAHCPDPGPSSDFAGFAADVVVIGNDQGLHESCMLIADTPDRRRQGLMGQDDLDGYAGMAFLFPDEEERSFWMKDTRIPLSIAFFDSAGRFVSSRDMEPCDDGSDCPTYPSNGPAQFAVEVPQGELASVGATPGSSYQV